ncbi:TPA: 2-oxo acid dehydrogenase subunit E2 [Candidatus Geothermarchaeota archaeon]|nr:2-oxo acid dehydrogenase subunit E2 [Candidatus Geothermarchaeota archaeon]
MVKKIYKLPDIGEGIAEGEIVKWLVKEGDYVKQFQPIVEVLTAKAKVEIPSPYEGKIVRILAKEGELVPVGSPLLEIEVVDGEARESPDKPVVEEPIKQEVGKSYTGKRVKAPPGVRLLAKRLGVDLSRVQGTGPKGIITKADVESYVASISPEPVPEKPVSKEVLEERIEIRGIRRFMFKNMAEAKRVIPHAYLIEEVDVTELWSLRERVKKYGADRGVKITILPFIIKAVISALKEYPLLNSSVDDEKGEIIVKKYYNIGLAVDAGEALVVPNIKDADKKSIVELAREIRSLADKARKGELTLDDVSGGTFTITNIGSIGSIAGMAVINPPEVAILGVHRIFERPVLDGDRLVNRKFMYLSISFDHRVLEGAYVTRFLMRLKELLENPYILLIE